MNNFEKINEAFLEATIKAKSALDGIENLIHALPDNAGIQRLGGMRTGCFIVNSSDVFKQYTVSAKKAQSTNWTPEFYDFKLQYEAVITELRRQRWEDIAPTFEKIINERTLMRTIKLKLRDWRGDIISEKTVDHRYQIFLHPEVVENLKKIIQ